MERTKFGRKQKFLARTEDRRNGGRASLNDTAQLRSLLRHWAAVARKCGYRVGLMADRLGISARRLEQLCHRFFGRTPRQLLVRWRHREIRQLARSKHLGKEIIGQIGLAHCSSLSRCMKSALSQGLRALKNAHRRDAISQKAKLQPLTRRDENRDTGDAARSNCRGERQTEI